MYRSLRSGVLVANTFTCTGMCHRSHVLCYHNGACVIFHVSRSINVINVEVAVEQMEDLKVNIFSFTESWKTVLSVCLRAYARVRPRPRARGESRHVVERVVRRMAEDGHFPGRGSARRPWFCPFSPSLVQKGRAEPLGVPRRHVYHLTHPI